MANLRTQGDIITDFLVKMNQSTTTAFYTDQILTTWASNAYSWAAAKYKWPMTEGRYSTTSASMSTNEDGYTALQYPEGFRSDSVRLLTVGGKHFFKKNFYKFQSFIEDNPGDTTDMYTDRTRTIYINPTAKDLSGTVVLWGQINPAALGTDTVAGVSGSIGPDPLSTTIFTDVENDGNEAIVEKMISYALTREKSPTSIIRGKMVSASAFHASIAEGILDKIWARVAEEQFAYQDTLDEGWMKRFDVLRGGFKEDIFRRDQWF